MASGPRFYEGSLARRLRSLSRLLHPKSGLPDLGTNNRSGLPDFA
jgi:hypothetical protein